MNTKKYPGYLCKCNQELHLTNLGSWTSQVQENPGSEDNQSYNQPSGHFVLAFSCAQQLKKEQKDN